MGVRSEGEFELVLGNRQLFSVLGIVVILLGIFFAMGFFAGKTVGQTAANGTTTAQSPADASPTPGDASQSAKPPAVAPPTVAPEAASPDPAPAVEKERAPSVEERPAAPVKKETAASKKEAQLEAKAAVPKGLDQVVEPAPGSYLQVASTRLSEAQSLAALLRKHQFHVVLAKSPKAVLIRVLVGPFTSPESTTEARAKLKSLDIAIPYPAKYPQN